MNRQVNVTRPPRGRALAAVAIGFAWLFVSGCATHEEGIRPTGVSAEDHGPPRPRVAVVVFEDDRPATEREPAGRIESGDVLYPYYSYDTEREGVSFRCGFLGLCTAFPWVRHRIPEEAAERLLREGMASRVFSFDSRSVPGPADWPSERFRELKSEGTGVLITGKLERLYGMAYHPVQPWTAIRSWRLLSAFSQPDVEIPVHQVNALARISEMRVIDLVSGKVIWEGSVEAGVDRIDSAVSPREAADEALHGAISEFIYKFKQLEISSRP
jgi:hypothetical protein